MLICTTFGSNGNNIQMLQRIHDMFFTLNMTTMLQILLVVMPKSGGVQSGARLFLVVRKARNNT